MIPGGFEKNGFDSEDEFDDQDSNEGFVFDFVDKSKSKYTSLTLSNEVNSINTSIMNKNDDDWDAEDPKTDCKKDLEPLNYVDFEFKKKFRLDESKILLKELENAIKSFNLDRVKYLIESNTLNVNSKLTNSHWIPLMYAASYGCFSITKYLIERGADLNFEDDSFTVLMCACGCSNPSASEYDLARIVELLISKGADVNLADKYNQTPLMYASRANNCALLDILLEHDADLNAVDDNNWTALAHAASKGNLKCVHKLLSSEADALIYSHDYMYAHDLAEKSGHVEAKQLIKRYLKCKKIDSLKLSDNNGIIGNYFDSDQELEDQDDGLLSKKNNYEKLMRDDLESFLGALKLSNLSQLFKMNKVSMTDLANFNDEKLKNIGILDSCIRDLILNEMKKFHRSNWKSSSLISVSHDSVLSMNECVAMITNISRHIDYISANIKYIFTQGIESNSELFADKFLNARFDENLSRAKLNCSHLNDNLDIVCEIVHARVKHFENENSTMPIDFVSKDLKQNRGKRWHQSPLKFTALAAITLSTLFICKTKFFN